MSNMFTETTKQMSEKYGYIEPAFKKTEEAFSTHMTAFAIIQQEVETLKNYIKQLEGTSGGSFQKLQDDANKLENDIKQTFDAKKTEADQVLENIKSAFVNQQNNIDALNKQMKDSQEAMLSLATQGAEARGGYMNINTKKNMLIGAAKTTMNTIRKIQ